MKVALIDIGSNTSKLLIAEIARSNSSECFSVVEENSLPCRLIDSSTNHNGLIDQQKLESLLLCLQKFKKTCERYDVKDIKIVATEAFRTARNSSNLCKYIEKETGFRIEILTGHEEAMGIAQGFKTDPALKTWNDYIGLDIGGGSIEVIEVINQKVNQVKSLPLGAVHVALGSKEDFSEKISPIALANAQEYVRNVIGTQLHLLSLKTSYLAASGGTLVFLRKILDSEKVLPTDGLINRLQIEETFEKSCAITTAARIKMFPNLPTDRADIFPFGLLAIMEIMKFLNMEQLVHSYHNLRYGLIHEMLNS